VFISAVTDGILGDIFGTLGGTPDFGPVG